MNAGRIKAIIIRHLYLYKGRSLPRFMDIFFWPVMTLLTWGFFSVYLNKFNLSNVNFFSVLLGAVVFWEVVQTSQQAVSVYFLEDVWEKNFLNIFVTPLTLGEFFVATAILAIIKLCITCSVLFIVAFLFYHYSVFSLGFAFIPYVINLFAFGMTVAVFINGIILRFGTSAQVLAFGIILILQPLSAVFYPVSALPGFLHPISYALPITYVFESMRATIAGMPFDFHSFWISALLNIVYFTAACLFFRGMFLSVKRKGILLKVQN